MAKIIGLTGPIGSGKDTVAKILKRHGALIIDADTVGHQLLIPQSPAWSKIVHEFGVRVLRAGGTINRRKLAKMVFDDPNRLKKLNQIMHPPMVKEIVKCLDQVDVAQVFRPAKKVAQTFRSANLIIINAALLKEMGLIPFVDEVWTVLAPLASRMKWLEKKGYDKHEIKLRIKAQAKISEYKKIADVVINNNGTLKQLKNRVIILF